ncbi:hypothetical protein CsSME_00041636 [Camellia sinensis var. sinensis]
MEERESLSVLTIKKNSNKGKGKRKRDSPRCFDSNLVEIPVEVETPDHHYYHFAFFTSRKVQALEELTWDYGIDFDDHDHPGKAFTCRYGSKFCRNIKHSSSNVTSGLRGFEPQNRL